MSTTRKVVRIAPVVSSRRVVLIEENVLRKKKKSKKSRKRKNARKLTIEQQQAKQAGHSSNIICLTSNRTNERISAKHGMNKGDRQQVLKQCSSMTVTSLHQTGGQYIPSTVTLCGQTEKRVLVTVTPHYHQKKPADSASPSGSVDKRFRASHYGLSDSHSLHSDSTTVATTSHSPRTPVTVKPSHVPNVESSSLVESSDHLQKRKAKCKVMQDQNTKLAKHAVNNKKIQTKKKAQISCKSGAQQKNLTHIIKDAQVTKKKSKKKLIVPGNVAEIKPAPVSKTQVRKKILPPPRDDKPQFNHSRFKGEDFLENVYGLTEEQYQASLPGYSTDVDMLDVSSDVQCVDFMTDMQVDNASTNQRKFCIILDTNVLMADLKFIGSLKDRYLTGYGPPYFTIPWVVFQELDSLKNRANSNKFQAVDAVRFLNKLFTAKHPRFFGQSRRMALQCRKEKNEMNDDSILECCLDLATKVPVQDIVLLSNDKNLCNKALISNIAAHTVTSFKKFLEQRGTQEVTKNAPKVIAYITEDEPVVQPQLVKAGHRKEVDSILCEIRMLLKCVLDPCMEKFMHEAFTDVSVRFLPKPPRTLGDILTCFKKYWISCFGCVLPSHLLKHFENLTAKLVTDCTFEVEDALDTLKSITVICKELSKTSPDIESYVERIDFLEKQCRVLNGEMNFMGDNKYIRSSEIQRSEGESNEIVLAVFHHNWELINHVCGMLMDILHLPNDFVYEKQGALPSLQEFRDFLPNFYPALHTMKKSMAQVSKLLEKPANRDEKEVSKIIKCLYDNLLQFIPSLKIQAPPPPSENFTVKRLEVFLFDPNNRELIGNGLRQLDNYYSKLNECLQDPIWKK